jgi:glutathione S-transferase
MRTDAAHLYTFWISHFSEKARWCLELEGVPFVEHPLLPGPHVATIKKLAPHRQVPVLTYKGEVVQGSSAIVDAIPRLFGKSCLQSWRASSKADADFSARCQELETMADESFGRAIQAFGYDALLQDRGTLLSLWNFRGPWWGRAFYAVAYPLMEKRVRDSYCGDAESVAKSREALLAGLQRTDEILKRQDYLLGDVPTRADVSVAALLSPLVRPQEHPMTWPRYPDSLEEFCLSQNGRPTWDFTVRMYRDHR